MSAASASSWGQHFEQTFGDIAMIQEELAQDIFQTLRLALTPRTRDAMRAYGVDNETYQLYLKAQYRFNQESRESIETAIDLGTW